MPIVLYVLGILISIKKHMQCSDVSGGTYIARGSGSMLPQGKFEFSAYIRWYLLALAQW